MTERRCRQCGAPAARWWPYCTQCDSLYGVSIVAWVIVGFLAVGVYAMVFGDLGEAMRRVVDAR